MKYLIKISYLGTKYCGFQIQPNQITIQGELERAANTIFAKNNAVVSGCSRTDTGVHAREYYACVQSDDCPSIPPDNFTKAMNTFLPEDICVNGSWTVKDDFRIKRAVIGKRYEYVIRNTQTPDPFDCDRSFYYPREIDDSVMNKTAEYFIGKHDFKSFMASGSEIENTVRTISECSVKRDGNYVKIRIAADGFLYNMVRIICGTLLEVSEKKLKSEDVKEIINNCERKEAGRTLPGCGLFLDEVFLDNEYVKENLIS